MKRQLKSALSPGSDGESSSRNPGKKYVGRGSSLKPANPFLSIECEDDFSQLVDDPELTEGKIATEYVDDDAQSIISENNSPDIPFRYSLNPYRGCGHGCAYCYARPTHEFLGFNAGIDFETKIFVKRQAGQLLRRHLMKKSWVGEPIMMSGVTDCYQPAEREFHLTRNCLEVAREFNQPLGIITKNALVVRDLDLLAPMAEQRLTRVAISITSLDQQLTCKLEPRTSAPQARLRAISELAEANVEVTVMVAPVIPGLNDAEIAAILAAAKEHGATNAGYILLRLPQTVEPVFRDWLQQHEPQQQEKIEERIQQTRAGGMNQSQFGTRMRGTGVLAEQMRSTFRCFADHYGLAREAEPLDSSLFKRPVSEAGKPDRRERTQMPRPSGCPTADDAADGQLWLF